MLRAGCPDRHCWRGALGGRQGTFAAGPAGLGGAGTREAELLKEVSLVARMMMMMCSTIMSGPPPLPLESHVECNFA